MASKHIEDAINEYLSSPIQHVPGMVQYMDVRSLLSSAAIELRSLRVLCEHQRNRINHLLMEDNDD